VVHLTEETSQPMEGFKQNKCITSSNWTTQNVARDKDNGSDCATEWTNVSINQSLHYAISKPNCQSSWMANKLWLMP